ncbi:GNAT family N-acetyltransferase [Candidatus Pacearchaeota archaeon]|nr:GNAT family N-acetyltransferase [Candidatus Pacearchaeota archaeon]
MTRLATLDDLSDMLVMGEKFFYSSGYQNDIDFCPHSTAITLINLIKNNTLLFSEGGMLGFSIVPIFMSSDIMAQELFWWVDEDKRNTGLGIELLSEFERIAEENNARIVSMLCLDDSVPGIENIYKKRGYRRREQNYTKRLR